MIKTTKWEELAKADELASAEAWKVEASRRELIELKERQKLKNLALKIRKENEKRSKARKEKIKAEQTEKPQGEFYATIRGPNYDNVWRTTTENLGDELAKQIASRTELTSDFFGMTNEELLVNKPLLKRVGLCK